MSKREIEILAPAGNVESFRAAVNAGADAVYMGLGKHNARVMAKNFTLEDYIACIDYAHIRGVKVYLTLNTLVEDEEIKEALEMLTELYAAGLDAVILQDIGMAMIIRDVFPNLDLHASTQMSAYSLEQVKFLQNIGFTRVVLARELTLEEIKYITSNTDVEIEAFIHGALCVSVSGQCLMSLSIGTRSANRGACAQPCRMKYSLACKDKVIEKERYLLSKKDIYGLDILNEIIDANFISLKIEGRNKTPEYVATVISTYRKYVDMYKEKGQVVIENEDEKNLLQMFNRNGKSNGYLKGVRYKDSITLLTPKNTGLYLGEVISSQGKFVKVKIEEDIDLHDGIEIYSKDDVHSTIVTCIKDKNGKIINSKVEAGNIVYIGDFKKSGIESGDKIYKTSSKELIDNIEARYVKKQPRKRDIIVSVDIKENSPVTLSAIINEQMYLYNTNIIPETAMNKELTLDDLMENFAKTQESGIRFSKVVGYVQKGLFLRVSQINEIRRNFVAKIEEKYCVRRDVKEVKKALEYKLGKITKYNKENACINVLNVYTYNPNKNYVDTYYIKTNKKLQRIDFSIKDFIKYESDIFEKYGDYEIGVNIPNVTLNNMDKYIRGNLESIVKRGVKYIILGSFRYLDLVLSLREKYDFKLVADYSFNVCNSYSASFMASLGFDIITAAFDTTPNQIEKMKEYVNVELFDDYVTVMTSRYCPVGSFVANRKPGEVCSSPCTKDNYWLVDNHNEHYYLVCNNVDCITQIVKKNTLNKTGLSTKIISVRNNEL